MLCPSLFCQSNKLYSLVALFCISTLISASLSASPLDASVERAKFIVHVKVVGMERADTIAEKHDDGSVLYDGDWAVCEVKKIVLGMVATDTNGQLRVTSASEKSTVKLDNPVRLKKGDEFTIIADRCTLNNKVGMILPGESTRIDGAPGNDLLKLLDDRIQRAKGIRDTLSELLPGAQAEVEKALTEFDEMDRDDFRDLSPNADLLFDFCALAQYTPDLADFPRPALNDSDRKRLTLLALRAACELDEESAEIASAIVEGKGNGALALTRPAEIEDSKALETLRRLSARENLQSVLGWLLRHDVEGRAAAWATRLSTGNDATSKVCEWALVECAEGGFFDRKALIAGLAPKGTGTEYARALGNTIDKKALVLASWLLLCESKDAPAKGVQGVEGMSDDRKKQVANMYGSVELLQVYALALGMRGADDANVANIRGRMEGKVQARGELDLNDLQNIARELRYKDKLPEAVKRIARRSGVERR